MGIFINNDNDKEKINIEKILPNDDILIDDYSFKMKMNLMKLSMEMKIMRWH